MIISISGKLKSGKDTVGQMIMYLDDFYELKSLGMCERGEIPNEPSLKDFNDYLYNGFDLDNDKWQIKKFAYKVKEVASILTGIPVEDFNKQEVKEQTLGDEWIRWGVHFINDDPHYFSNKKDAKLFYNERSLAPHHADKFIKKHKLTVRELLQRIGTEAIRNQIHPNAWVNALFADYMETIDCSPNLVRTAGINVRSQGYPNWIITDTRFPNEVKAIKDRNGILIRVNRALLPPVTDGEHTVQFTRLPFNEHPSETALDDYEDWDYVIDNNGSLEDLLVKVKEIYEKIKIN